MTLANFPQKLHENEKKTHSTGGGDGWGCGVGWVVRCGRPLNPLMDSWKINEEINEEPDKNEETHNQVSYHMALSISGDFIVVILVHSWYFDLIYP